MKEAPEMAVGIPHHYHQNDDAVLLEDGRPLRHPYEVARIVQGVLGNTRKRLHDSALYKHQAVIPAFADQDERIKWSTFSLSSIWSRYFYGR